jgi:hypothetical protein
MLDSDPVSGSPEGSPSGSGQAASTLDVRAGGADMLIVPDISSFIVFPASIYPGGLLVFDDCSIALIGNGFGIKVNLNQKEAARVAAALRVVSQNGAAPHVDVLKGNHHA